MCVADAVLCAASSGDSQKWFCRREARRRALRVRVRRALTHAVRVSVTRAHRAQSRKRRRTRDAPTVNTEHSQVSRVNCKQLCCGVAARLRLSLEARLASASSIAVTLQLRGAARRGGTRRTRAEKRATRGTARRRGGAAEEERGECECSGKAEAEAEAEAEAAMRTRAGDRD